MARAKQDWSAGAAVKVGFQTLTAIAKASATASHVAVIAEML